MPSTTVLLTQLRSRQPSYRSKTQGLSFLQWTTPMMRNASLGTVYQRMLPWRMIHQQKQLLVNVLERSSDSSRVRFRRRMPNLRKLILPSNLNVTSILPSSFTRPEAADGRCVHKETTPWCLPGFCVDG